MKTLAFMILVILISTNLKATSLEHFEMMEQMDVFTLRDLADSYCTENKNGGYCHAKEVYFIGIRFDKENLETGPQKVIKISFPYQSKMYYCTVKKLNSIKRFEKRIAGWKKKTTSFFFFSWDENKRCLGFL